MSPKEIFIRTETLSKACMKVAMVLPHEHQMTPFAKVELIRYASDLGIRSKGLASGQLGVVFVEGLGKAIDSSNGCGFWLQVILENGLLDKREIIEPLIRETNLLSAMFMAALKTARNKMD